ncbi:hypothetical protein H3V53_39900 [Paraburkholderia bengalensis]|uniref:Uncharacterized protein n=1 Tax=Paraburkholderia bengalensis TaxID=2747562 RepID=A0ABU8J5T7_9BURK
MANQSKEMNVVQLTLSSNDIFARRELPWCDRTAVADHRRELWRPKITGHIGAVPMWGVILSVGFISVPTGFWSDGQSGVGKVLDQSHQPDHVPL